MCECVVQKVRASPYVGFVSRRKEEKRRACQRVVRVKPQGLFFEYGSSGMGGI